MGLLRFYIVNGISACGCGECHLGRPPLAEQHRGHCAAGYRAVSESECEDTADAVAGYWWGGAYSISWEPSGCSVGMASVVNYNRNGLNGGGADCSAKSYAQSEQSAQCICACALGRYSSAATPSNGACTACDAGIYLSLAVSQRSLSLSL